jgi:pyruvate kinase
MLSGETSTGKFPLEAVTTMEAIAREVEQSRFFQPTPADRLPKSKRATVSILRAACEAAKDPVRPMVVFTWSGRSARWISKARLPGPIYALTPNAQVVDQLALVFGITPVLVPAVRSTDELIHTAEAILVERGYAKKGEEIVLVVGNTRLRGATNMLRIAKIGE